MKKNLLHIAAFGLLVFVIGCGRSSTTDFPNAPSTFSSGNGNSNSYPSTFSGGAGTLADPYRISTVNDLKALDAHVELWDKNFILVNNIDLTGVEFNPYMDGFAGVFDGNNFALTNWTSNYPLFVTLSGTVKNLSVTGATITFHGNSRGGILTGTVSSTGTITSCYVQGSLAPTTAGIYFVGAIAAKNSGTIQYSSASATLQGGAGVGGIAGINGGNIYNSYFTGSVTATASGLDNGGQYGAGGIAGYSSGTIRDSYFASGTITADRLAGGIVGYNDGTILRTFASNNFSNISGANTGGIAGFASVAATTTSSYWDSQVSGLFSSAGGTSQTTSALYSQATFSGWNFTTNWYFPNSSSYPKLLGTL